MSKTVDNTSTRILAPVRKLNTFLTRFFSTLDKGQVLSRKQAELVAEYFGLLSIKDALNFQVERASLKEIPVNFTQRCILQYILREKVLDNTLVLAVRYNGNGLTNTGRRYPVYCYTGYVEII